MVLLLSLSTPGCKQKYSYFDSRITQNYTNLSLGNNITNSFVTTLIYYNLSIGKLRRDIVKPFLLVYMTKDNNTLSKDPNDRWTLLALLGEEELEESLEALSNR